MNEYVRVNPNYFDVIIDALEMPLPRITVFGTNEESKDLDEKEIKDSIRTKLTTLKNSFDAKDDSAMQEVESINEEEVRVMYECITNYRKACRKNLSTYKKGTKEYKKATKALETIPHLMATMFQGVVVEYEDD